MYRDRKLASSRLYFFLQGLVGACFMSCSSADAAPKTVRSTVSITAQVVEVDCTNRPVKIKACAPVFRRDEEVPQNANARNPVVTTVLFY